MSDAVNAAFQNRFVAIAVFYVIEMSEPQRVHQRDRTRAHRENVAQNSADAGRRALKRFDKRRMIVRFDLKRDAPIVADVHDARIFSRRHDDALARRRQTFK